MATAQALLNKFTELKTLPHVAIRLSKLISDENSNIREFENLIKMDPTLVLRLLRTANSSYYGLRQKISSISRAVILIGRENLRNMIVTVALKDIFESGSSEDVFSKRQLWLHCAAVAICSQMISERIFSKKGDDAFLCGILHDIGMIVENQVAHDLFIQACKTYEPKSKPITDYEREIIGTDHCAVGYLLIRDWQLPVEVQEGIKQHHRKLEDVSPSSITGIIQIAEYFVSKLSYTALPKADAILSPPLVAHISDNIEEYKVLINDLPDEMLKAKDLYESQEE